MLKNSSIIFSFSQGQKCVAYWEKKIIFIMYCFGCHCIIVVFAHVQSTHSKMSMWQDWCCLQISGRIKHCSLESLLCFFFLMAAKLHSWQPVSYIAVLVSQLFHLFHFYLCNKWDNVQSDNVFTVDGLYCEVNLKRVIRI